MRLLTSLVLASSLSFCAKKIEYQRSGGKTDPQMPLATLKIAEQALKQKDFETLATCMSKATIKSLEDLCRRRRNQSCTVISMLGFKIDEYSPHISNRLRTSAVTAIQRTGNSMTARMMINNMESSLEFVLEDEAWKINLPYDFDPREH